MTNSLVNTRDRATPCKGPELLREIVAAGSEGIYQGLILLLTLGFGAFLVYSTVRHGGAMALDSLGARRTVEGTVEEVGRWRHSYWLVVEGLPHQRPSVGPRARARGHVGPGRVWASSAS